MGLHFTSVLISFAIQSSVIGFVFGDLSKCCDLYFELSLEKNNTDFYSIQDFTCQPSTNATLSFTYSQMKINLPDCQQIRLVSVYDRNSKVACMDRVGQLNDVYGLACVDDPDLESSNNQRTTKKSMNEIDVNDINHQYTKNPNQTDTTDADTDNWTQTPSNRRQHNSFSITSITNIRKCCPGYRKYAADRQFCWSEFSSHNNKTLLDLPKLSVRHPDRFVSITIGAPPCLSSAVLVDNVVPSNRVVFENDALILNGTTYSFNEYCVDMVDDKFEYLVVRTCQDLWTECQLKGHLCVRKCCPADQEIDERSCAPSNESLKLFFHNVTNKRSSAPLILPVQVTPAFIFGNPCSEGKFMLDPDMALDSHVLTIDGTVFMKKSKEDLTRDNYCVDHFKSEGETRTFRCFQKSSKETDTNLMTQLMPKMTITCMTISAIFLLITFFVYLLLPSLHNLHGKLIMCYLLTSAISYSVVVLEIALQDKAYKEDGRVPAGICVTLGYIVQFTFLSSFCWLNIISYDIWSTFKAVRSAFLKKSSTFKRFTMFCLYGWGSSLLWTGLTLLCQYTPIISEKSSIKPDIGVTKCFFSSYSRSKLIFFVSPVLAMISFNVIIFIITVKHCANIRAELKKSNNNYSLKRYSADKNELIINLKLFIVMGLNWSMEVVSALIGFENETFFFISDLLNALGGVFIFSIFVLKRKVLIDLKAKLCGKRPRGRTFERATGFTTSTSSSIVMNFLNSRRSVSLNP